MSSLRRNVELKATLKSLERVREVARRLATKCAGVQRQSDTYFQVRSGRLKLREIAGQSGQLIWYVRPDEAAAKTSRYILLPVTDADGLRTMLEAALGRRLVVRKTREIFLVRNVRIHLDQVESLGCFIELEAVLAPEDAEEAGYRQLAELQDQFGIAPGDLLIHSYADMLEARVDGQ